MNGSTLLGCRDYMIPVLRSLSQAGPNGLGAQALADQVAMNTGLDEVDRTLAIRQGTPRFRVRIKQARYWLKNEGHVESTSEGTWRITSSGRTVLESGATRKPEEVLGKAREESRTVELAPAPEERIDDALRQIEADLAAEMLARLRRGPPVFFERSVLKLLSAMGYTGTGGVARHTGGAGDGGIDGLIERDPLGLDCIYVQAKRYNGQVSPNMVREFIGALAHKGATVGVFFTTGSFSKSASKLSGGGSGPRVRLIDGTALARQMIEFGVGVTNSERRIIPRIDKDFFMEE